MDLWRLLELPIEPNSTQAATLRSSFEWCAGVLELNNESKLPNDAVLELISETKLSLFISSSEVLDALNRGDLLEMLPILSED